MIWFIFAALLVGILLAKILSKESKETIDVQGKSVFISGCDTGFGHGLALRLDKLGMRVYAGCVTEKGINELRAKCSPNIQPFLCDITNPDHISNAVKVVSRTSPNGLFALVNNAGIIVLEEWDWSSEQSLRRVMEVNFFGHVAVTKAFLPLLKISKGRIVNLTSVAGIVASSRLGLYNCSKFAMEAFNDSLRRELRKWGISVFVIEPGYTATPMLDGMSQIIKKSWDASSDNIKREYGEEYGRLVTDFKVAKMDHPDLVIDELQNKVTLKYPNLRTWVGPSAKIIFVLSLLPTSWVDWYLERGNSKLIPAAMKKNL